MVASFHIPFSSLLSSDHLCQGRTQEDGAAGLQPPKPPQNRNLENDFVDFMISNVFCDFSSAEISR
jgi:hypothetical protein